MKDKDDATVVASVLGKRVRLAQLLECVDSLILVELEFIGWHGDLMKTEVVVRGPHKLNFESQQIKNTCS